MCGIAGIINNSELKISLDNLAQKMGASISYRGPDDNGVFYSKKLGIAITHRRLSILDLSTSGKQPMFSSSGRFIISFNGEIYNHYDLKKELISLNKDIIWKSTSDTEVLLNAWKFWGPDVLEKLDGMFAFSIWDRKKRILYLARDRFGKKPLVFSLLEETLAFSSDIRSLREIAYEGEIDKLAVRSLFRFTSTTFVRL